MRESRGRSKFSNRAELLRDVFCKRPAAITDTRRGSEAVDTIKYNGERGRMKEMKKKKAPQFCSIRY